MICLADGRSDPPAAAKVPARAKVVLVGLEFGRLMLKTDARPTYILSAFEKVFVGVGGYCLLCVTTSRSSDGSVKDFARALRKRCFDWRIPLGHEFH